MFDVLFSQHQYTLAATGFKMRQQVFATREEAREEMYSIIDNNGFRIVKKYDDNHFKTYICDNGVRFYINRQN